MKRNVQTGVIVLLCLALLLGGGCAAAPWSPVDPNQPRWTPPRAAPPRSWPAPGVRRTRIRTVRPKARIGFRVEGTAPEKLCAGPALVVAAPFTVAADVALVGVCLAVIGDLALAAEAAACEEPWPSGF